MTVGSRIRALRESRGWTLADLADKSDLDPGALSRIERGQVSPREQTMRAIADALNVPVTYLLTEDPSKDENTVLGFYRLLSPANRKNASDYMLFLFMRQREQEQPV